MKKLNPGEVITLAQRECSSIGGTWTEYLTLSSGQEKTFLLATAAPEILVDAYDYFNLETESYELPPKINGSAVLGLKDGWVIGGKLLIDSDNSGYAFNRLSDNKLAQWLVQTGWSETISSSRIREIMGLSPLDS